MRSFEIVSENEIKDFVGILQAYKGHQVAPKVIAKKLNTSYFRVLSIAAACKRAGIPVLTRKVIGEKGSNGYILGNMDNVSISQLKVGDVIDYFYNHFENDNDFANYWKLFEVVGEYKNFWLLETVKKTDAGFVRTGIKTTVLKIDIGKGNIKVVEKS